MSEVRKLICISCPRGCHLEVDENLNVTGNTCARGKAYGIAEVTNPTRMISSTVKITDGEIIRLPVSTSSPIPKGKIFDVMAEINKASAKAPIKCGDAVIKNVLGLGVDIIATRSVERI